MPGDEECGTECGERGVWAGTVAESGGERAVGAGVLPSRRAVGTFVFCVAARTRQTRSPAFGWSRWQGGEQRRRFGRVGGGGRDWCSRRGDAGDCRCGGRGASAARGSLGGNFAAGAGGRGPSAGNVRNPARAPGRSRRTFSRTTRVFLAVEPTDMRKGFDGLFALRDSRGRVGAAAGRDRLGQRQTPQALRTSGGTGSKHIGFGGPSAFPAGR